MMTARSISPVPLAVLVLALAACGSKPARVETEPSSLRFGVRGQTAKVHAAPIASNGTPLPDHVCKWSSSDEKVATVSGPHNDGVVTAVGPGNANITCTVGEVHAEVPVQVRVVGRVVAGPPRVELKMLDEAAPVPLQVQVFDDAGTPVQGRITLSRCASEDVCRGDARAQLWAVGPGDTTAVVEVEGARSGEIAVHVVDARTAAGKPQAVRGNPMLEIERAVMKRDEEERRAAEKARQAAGK